MRHRSHLAVPSHPTSNPGIRLFLDSLARLIAKDILEELWPLADNSQATRPEEGVQ